MIARDTTKETKESEETCENMPRFAKSIAVTVFMCIPGVMPVNVPIVHPSNNARIISRIILLCVNFTDGKIAFSL